MFKFFTRRESGSGVLGPVLWPQVRILGELAAGRILPAAGRMSGLWKQERSFWEFKSPVLPASWP